MVISSFGANIITYLEKEKGEVVFSVISGENIDSYK